MPEVVWRKMAASGWTPHGSFRWRWLARLYTWAHRRSGWFDYEVCVQSKVD